MAEDVLILIPGLLCDEAAWRPMIEALRSPVTVVVADCTRQATITAMADDILSRYSGQFMVAGHSMGGRVALEIVRLAPERVTKLALLDTGIHPRREGEEVKRQELVDLAYSQGMAALAAKWLPPMVHPARVEDETLIAPLTRMVERMTPEIHERQIKALLGRPDAAPGLRDIKVPTVLVVGRQDAWSPLGQHEAMLPLIAGARLQVIEDAGHFAPVERPREVAAALDEWIATN